MEEIWKDVKGFESLYMVSNLGRVKNVPHYVTRKYYRPSTGDNIEDKFNEVVDIIDYELRERGMK